MCIIDYPKSPDNLNCATIKSIFNRVSVAYVLCGTTFKEQNQWVIDIPGGGAWSHTDAGKPGISNRGEGKIAKQLGRSWVSIYSGPCILRPPLQPDKYGLKLEVVLKWRDIYTENIRMVILTAGLKMEGIVKWRDLKSEGPLYIFTARM